MKRLLLRCARWLPTLRSTARADVGRGAGPATLPAAAVLISLAGALLLLTYPFLVRWSAVRGLPNAALIAWSALFGAWGLRHRRARWGWLAAALFLLAAATLDLTPVWLAYAPPVVINLALAVLFKVLDALPAEPAVPLIACPPKPPVAFCVREMMPLVVASTASA